MNCERMDKYDYLIAMSALDVKDRDVELFEKLDTSDVFLSDRIQQKIEKLFKIERKQQKKPVTKGRMIFSRVAIIVLVVISITFTAMMSVSAIRNAVWNAIIEWYDKYITVDYKTDDPVSPPTVIEKTQKPTVLPLGFEENNIFNDELSYLSEFYLNDECRMIYEQSLLNEGEEYIDNETAVIRNVNIGIFDGLLLTYEKNVASIILWNDGEYQYSLTGYGIDADTMILIAESVK